MGQSVTLECSNPILKTGKPFIPDTMSQSRSGNLGCSMQKRTANLVPIRNRTASILLLFISSSLPCFAGDHHAQKVCRDVERQRLNSVEQELTKGSVVNAPECGGKTPLLVATSNANTEMIRLLLQHGSDVNANGTDGRTPLAQAAGDGRMDIVQTFVAAGANIGAKDNQGWTPLEHAAANGKDDICQLLLAKGADVNGKDDEGWTPLARAVAEAQLQVATLLLARNADVNARDNAGWTPLSRAADAGYSQLANILLDDHADFNSKDSEGWTPLGRAAKKGNVSIAALLLSKEEAAPDAVVQAGKLREGLQQYLEILQQLPDNAAIEMDESLREKIIKVVLQLNPPPALPEEAVRHAAYAQAALAEANKAPDSDTGSSYLDNSISEWQKALRIAPWWGQAYFNMAAVLEKTQRPAEAAQALQLDLTADPHAANAQDINMEIYKLHYEADQYAKAARLNGTWRDGSGDAYNVTVHGNDVTIDGPYSIKLKGTLDAAGALRGSYHDQGGTWNSPQSCGHPELQGLSCEVPPGESTFTGKVNTDANSFALDYVRPHKVETMSTGDIGGLLTVCYATLCKGVTSPGDSVHLVLTK